MHMFVLVVFFIIILYYIHFIGCRRKTVAMAAYQPLAHKVSVGDRVRVSCYEDISEGVILSVNPSRGFISLHSGSFHEINRRVCQGKIV